MTERELLTVHELAGMKRAYEFEIEKGLRNDSLEEAIEEYLLLDF